MNDTQYDVIAIGNAIVDVLARAEESFLAEQGLPKGAMSLIDAAQSEKLYSLMGAGVEASGGSAANTVAGIAGLGGRAAFIGTVADDQLGQVFAHDIRAVGVDFHSKPLTGSAPTARCLILVTPDGQRTMQTFLGAAIEIGAEDIDESLIASAKVVYLEGYLWDQPRAIEAMLKAAKAAKAAGREVALTTSDPFCVDRHRAEFLQLIEDYVDILFANEEEIKSLYQTHTFEEALAQVRGKVKIAALTRSEKGSVIINKSAVHMIEAVPGVQVVDTTGAGDAYAAGFLYAYTQGMDLQRCGRLGGMLAAEVISHYGARAETDLKAMAAAI